MFINESPNNDHFGNWPAKSHEIFKDYFNWTMTYRRDSDFYQPYGWITPKHWTWHYPYESAKENWSQFSMTSTLGCLFTDYLSFRTRVRGSNTWGAKVFSLIILERF